jgi:hypothetical protein
MSEFDMLENGFFMIKEDQSYSSPIATLFYEYYDDEHQLLEKINADADLIQCTVTNKVIPGKIDFGQSQHPKLNDFADGINTFDFLKSL